MSHVLPPNEVFEHTPSFEVAQQIAGMGARQENFWKATVCHRGKLQFENYFPVQFPGMYSYQQFEAYPLKGHPYLQAGVTNNEVKRVSLFLMGLISNPFKKGWLENQLINYARLADSIYNSVTPCPYLKEEWYNPCSRELWRLTYHFLMNIGISEETSYRCGRIIATIIEYDDAYRYPLEDLFTESSKEKMLAHSRKEIIRLAGIFQQRQISYSDKIPKVMKVASFLLYWPKFNKAFKKALQKVDFPKLQLDFVDRYWVFNRPDYQYLGLKWEVRKSVYDKIRQDFIIKQQNYVKTNSES